MGFVDDARAQINNGQFSEDARYCPYKGMPRDIKVILNRNPVSLDIIGGVSAPALRYEAIAIRSLIDGIQDPDLGNDILEVKSKRTDMNSTPFRIVSELNEDDDGAITLEIVK